MLPDNVNPERKQWEKIEQKLHRFADELKEVEFM